MKSLSWILSFWQVYFLNRRGERTPCARNSNTYIRTMKYSFVIRKIQRTPHIVQFATLFLILVPPTLKFARRERQNFSSCQYLFLFAFDYNGDWKNPVNRDPHAMNIRYFSNRQPSTRWTCLGEGTGHVAQGWHWSCLYIGTNIQEAIHAGHGSNLSYAIKQKYATDTVLSKCCTLARRNPINVVQQEFRH